MTTPARTAVAAAADITLFFHAHPFAPERTHARLPAGQTLDALVAACGIAPELRPYLHAFIDGHHIPRENWARLRPRAGTTLTLRMVPMGGGGGKNPLRTVLSLALVVASPVIAGAIAGALGVGAQAAFMGISAARLITAGVNIAGRLALNALAPPGKPRFGLGKTESPTLFLQGARNQATPFGRVPRVLGRHRFVPPLGALPYTETAGNDQYLRMIFIWGYGPLEITDLHIGETPLSEFEDVEIETRSGWPDDAPLTLYSTSVIQNGMEVVLREENGYALRTTESEADEISVDLTLPRGLVGFNGSGKKIAAEVAVEVQYSPAGENNWSAASSAYTAIDARHVTLAAKPDVYKKNGKSYTASRTDRIVMDAASGTLKVLKGSLYRTGHDAAPPELPKVAAGYLPVARIERRSDDADIIPAPRITDERDFAASRFEQESDFAAGTSFNANRIEISAGGLRYPGFSLSAKQSAAVRQSLSFRVPRGRYDVRLRRVTPDSDDDRTFNDTVWTALRSLRYAYPVRMQGLAMTALRIKATDQLNGILDRLSGVVESILPDWNGTDWVLQPTSNPASLYRHALQGAGNARPLADGRIDMGRLAAWHETCAAEGREFNAVIDYDTSLREVLQDIAAAGRASPSLTDGKWSIVEDRPQSVPVQHFSPRNTWGFQGRKAFDDVPDGLRVRFINRAKDWRQDERLVFKDGVTAETALRYETITLPGVTDAQQAWRDGRYHLASAILRPETYTFCCDIEHIVCTRGDMVRFTHDVPMFGLAAARVAALHRLESDETRIGAVVLDSEVGMESDKNYALRLRRADGTSIVLSLETAVGAHNQLHLSTPQTPEALGIAAGDLALFGESGQESVALVVRGIEPMGDLAARLTCVDAAPEIHLADKGVIPAFSSQISVPPELRRPPAPQLTAPQTAALKAEMTGTQGSDAQSSLLINLAAHDFPQTLSLRADIRAKDESFFTPAEITRAADGRAVIEHLREGETYDLRLRYVSQSGVFSPAFLLAGYRIDALGPEAPAVGGLSLNIVDSTAYVSWPRNTAAGLSHYTLRFSPVLSGAAWNSAVDVVARIPPDTTALSVPAAVGSFLLKAVDIRGRESEIPALAVSAVAGLAGYNAVAEAAEAPDFAGTHDATQENSGTLQLATGQNAGIYTFANAIDLGAVFTSLVSADILAGGIDRAESCDDWPDCDLVENRDGDADPARWRLRLQIRTTQDDPALSPAWSAWQDAALGEYTARAFAARLLLESDSADITPVVSQLTLRIDMPDRRISARGLTADSAGSDIVFAPAFRAVPAVAITAQNMQSGDYYAITDVTATGFSIRFFNAGGSGIERDFDYLAQGYGAQHST
ncbi:MAG TPA: host specificity factor TipJ family phage tail protein [Alphaproteobacteria bacterium]|nr:host specificity factor TipJ family phage tail protein [Alphaproteobacteria bacterium]